jgi:hypothetical protein
MRIWCIKLGNVLVVHITGYVVANLDLCLVLLAFSSEGSPTCDMGPPSERPMIFTLLCSVLGEGAITTHHDLLDAERATTRIPQLVNLSLMNYPVGGGHCVCL